MRPGEEAVATAAVSHIGASPKRTLLEDRGRAGEVRTSDGMTLSLGVVADGIGGANAGERAAEVTVNTIFEHCRHASGKDVPAILEAALKEANQRVHAESRHDRRKSNMGSTAAVAAIADNRLYVANVGDSRIYLIRGTRVTRLTVDHTWEQEIVSSGKLSPREAARHPRKDEIVRSIGYEAAVEVDLGLWLNGGEEGQAQARASQGLVLQPGDLVLVCSDGLTKTRHDNPGAHYLEETELPSLIKTKPTKLAAEALVKRALAAKVDDNVTVVLLEVPGRQIASRPLATFVGIGAAFLLFAVGGIVFLPRVFGLSARPSPVPTIPPLPSGVAFVSDFHGEAVIEAPGSPPRQLRPEEIIAARGGLLLRTLGADSSIRLGLADQSIVYLGPNSEIELIAIADGSRVQETVLILTHGVLLSSADPMMNLSFVVRTPDGQSARILGSVMGVLFDDRLRRLDVDCFSGHCQVGTEALGDLPRVLSPGEHVAIGGDGTMSASGPTRNELYAFAGFGGGLVPTPTSLNLGSSSQASATRTPLGPLFVPPTPTPRPPPTQPPPEPTEPPVAPTDVPTATTIPPTSTKTSAPSRTPTAIPATTEVPTPTVVTPAPSSTPSDVPTDLPTAPPTSPPTATQPPGA